MSDLWTAYGSGWYATTSATASTDEASPEFARKTEGSLTQVLYTEPEKHDLYLSSRIVTLGACTIRMMKTMMILNLPNG